MKNVSCKKYYEFFDNNIYRNDNIIQSVFTTKHTYKEEWYDKNGGRKLICMRTEECWEDENGYHKNKEYFIDETYDMYDSADYYDGNDYSESLGDFDE